MGIIVLVVVLAVLMTAFAWGMMRTIPPTISVPVGWRRVMSPPATPVPPSQLPDLPDSASDQAQNREPGNQGPAEPAGGTGLSESRKLAIVAAVRRCVAQGMEDDSIAVLLLSHHKKEQLAKEVRHLLKAEVPAGMVATLLGGNRKDLLLWIKELAAQEPEAQVEVETIPGHREGHRLPD